MNHVDGTTLIIGLSEELEAVAVHKRIVSKHGTLQNASLWKKKTKVTQKFWHRLSGLYEIWGSFDTNDKLARIQTHFELITKCHYSSAFKMGWQAKPKDEHSWKESYH